MSGVPLAGSRSRSRLRKSRRLAQLSAIGLSAAVFAPLTAAAQSAIWLPNPGSGSFNDGTNWSGGSVPTDLATFGLSTVTSLTLNAGTTVNTLVFAPGAPAYSFVGGIILAGVGIVDNSANAPRFTPALLETIAFVNGASAGNAILDNAQSFLLFRDSATAGSATIINRGVTSFTQNATAGSADIMLGTGGFVLSFADDSSAGNATITANPGSQVQFAGNASAGSATITLDNSTLLLMGNASAGSARIVNNTGSYVDTSWIASATSIGSIEGAGDLFLGGSQLTVGGLDRSTAVSGTINDGGNAGGGGGSLVKVGTGTLTLTGANTYTGGTTVNGGLINFSAAGNFGTGRIVLNGGGLQWAAGNTTDISGRLAPLGAGGGTIDTNGNDITLASAIGGAGGLTKAGAGTLNLAGNNTYAGGTTVTGGTLQGTTSSLQGNIVNNATVVFNQAGSGTYAGSMSGTGSMTLQGGGVMAVTGTNTYTGATTVNASTLVVNGSLAGPVMLSNGMLGGGGDIGGLVSNGGTLAPGNSVGTLTVKGSFVQNGGAYVVEADARGRSDRVNVAGTATIDGATIQVAAAPGNYANSTTYTVLNATGGISGAYSGVSSDFAFLTPSLSYDANNVFLTLALQANAFSGFGGNTPNQRSVGYALDQSWANASGDFATAIGALASLRTAQASTALDTISGQPYADFGSFNVANNALFMNALGQQMAQARDGARGAAGSGQRQALAEACDVAACDGTSPFSVWASALGGVGSVQGNGNSSTFTYNVGGTAAGIDYRVSPGFLVGLGASFTSGTQWVDSFQGKGWSNTVSVAAYASFTQSAFYLDALAGYAYSNNQLQRQISIPGLQPRTANGSTGANQLLAQAEAGYRIDLYAPAAATVTPFARFQTSSINQAAFQEWGANSLSLNVQQQTTTSVRTVLGAELAGAIANVDLGLRLGWLHEFADTARPMTAAFAGAPSASFTVYGATPQRDAAVIGFQATTTVAAATQLYLRYDGDIGSGTDNHALNLGLRLSW